MEDKAALVELFQKVGLTKEKSEETLKNKSLAATLKEVISEAKAETSGTSKDVGMLLYLIATKYPENSVKHRRVLCEYVAGGKMKTSAQVQGAMTYLKSVTDNGELSIQKLEESSGVGVSYTEQEVASAVKDALENQKEQIRARKHNVGVILGLVRKKLFWADPKVATDEINKQLEAMLSTLPPPSAEETQEKEKKAKEEKKEAKPAQPKKAAEPKETTLSESVHFPPPEQNYQKFPHLLEQHLKETGGQVRTRFPPEPNGYLHIGHAKSMNLNFNYAKKNGGVCYLRYDDTNPEKEKQVYIDSIADTVKWLGHRPWKVTYASDYFDKLYANAVDLIKKGKAFVEQETKEEMKEGRENKRESRYRNRSVEENLRLFEDMRDGKFDAGAAVLRLKIDMQSPNPCMRDPVAYRIKFVPHPHVGDKWCIYPSYDYTHCLCDSYENITHSLCTLEFEVRREVYNWVLETAEVYRPPQIEFARLNLTQCVISKRYIKKLVEEGYVRGWDDPRLATLMALRRRGYSTEAINNFCEAIGISRHNSVLDYSVLEDFIRKDMDIHSKRTFVVLRPLRVVITNFPEGEVKTVQVRNHPTDESMGSRDVPISRVLYIERSDFNSDPNAKILSAKGKPEDFFGLVPGKEVRLRYAFIIKCTNFVADANGEIKEVHVTYHPDSTSKPKGIIHWVSEPAPNKAPQKAEVRMYSPLFTGEVDTNDSTWITKVNRDSLEVISAYAEPSLSAVVVGAKYQFERLGFFCVDPDTTPELPVFNLTVSLKDAIAASKSKTH